MPVISGGWTVDAGYVEYLDQSGMAWTLFKAAVIESLRQRLAALESAGALTAAEKALQDSIAGNVERVIQFIRLEPKYIARGVYMPFSDITVCITNQWANILKRWG